MSRPWENTYEPFYLGIPGEKWSDEFPGLMLPSSLGISLTAVHYDLRKNNFKYALVITDGGAPVWHYYEDLIMLASAVHLAMEKYPCHTPSSILEIASPKP